MRSKFRLMMDGKLVDYYRTLGSAVAFGQRVNTNRVRSSGQKAKRQTIQVFLDDPDGSTLMFEGKHP